MNVNIKRRLSYHDLFDEEPLTIKEYLDGIGRDLLLKSIAYLVNSSHEENINQSATKLLNQWFGNENKFLKNHLLSKVKESDNIINIISSLNLVELVLQTEFGEEQKLSNSEIEVNLLKAYLIINVNQDKIEEKGHKNLPSKEDIIEWFRAFALTINFHDSDIQNYKLPHVLVHQLIKSIEFFKYLESRKELEPHLRAFLNKYHCENWKSWIKQYLGVLIPIIEKSKKTYFDYSITKDENFDKNCLFLESFTLVDSEKHELSDFIALRSSPLLKVETGNYRILNKLFLIEKLFKSIQFQFSLQINKELPQELQIKDFRSDHCDNFSERTLLYKLLRQSFPKKFIHISGDDFLSKGYHSEPDYYVRFKNKIFLFESKDVVLKGDEKQSRDYEILKKALQKKFYKIQEKDKIEPKAILQFIENIKRIINIYYDKCDNNYNSDQVKIYPILVTHDRQFDSLAVNHLISDWFKKELETLDKKYNTKNIQDITILNIDTLLFYQEAFKSRGNCRIEKLISDYHEQVNFDPKSCKTENQLEQQLLDSFRPFSAYVDQILAKQKTIKLPSHIANLVKHLFETD